VRRVRTITVDTKEEDAARADRQYCARIIGHPDAIEARRIELAASGGPPDEYDMEYEEAVYAYELYHFPEEFAVSPEDVGKYDTYTYHEVFCEGGQCSVQGAS
jgi:hypothetical protein